MKKHMFMFVMMIAAVVSSNQAFARGGAGTGILAGLNLFYNSTTDEVADPTADTSKTTRTSIDLNLGYIMSNSVYLGLIYFTDTRDSEASYKPTISGYGASVGYCFDSGWTLKGHYIVDSTFDKYASSTSKWTN